MGLARSALRGPSSSDTWCNWRPRPNLHWGFGRRRPFVSRQIHPDQRHAGRMPQPQGLGTAIMVSPWVRVLAGDPRSKRRNRGSRADADRRSPC